MGLPTYESKDLGLPLMKFDAFKYDKSIIVTGMKSMIILKLY